MNHKRSMTNRILAMLLSLVLCLSLVPQTVFATSDVSGGAAACVTVKDGAKTAYEVAAGGLLTVRLDELFQDSGSHGLTYTLDSGDYGAILRAKGIVHSEDGKWLHFDFVPEEHQIRFGAADYTGRLCVIGAELKEDKLAELFGL